MAVAGSIGLSLRVISARPLTNPGLLTTRSAHLTRGYHITARHTQSHHNLHQLPPPPLLRSSLRPTYQHGPQPGTPPLGKRSFSVIPFIEASIATTQHHISSFHALTGIPWYITIPLVALAVNTFTRLPITIYTNKIARRRLELGPLLQAWYVKHATAVSREGGGQALSQAETKKVVEKRFNKSTRRLFRAFGVQRWKDFLNLAIFPVWLTVIESLRRLSGASYGLLGRLVGNTDTGMGDAAVTASQATGTETVASSSGSVSALSLPPPPTTGSIDISPASDLAPVTDLAPATATTSQEMIQSAAALLADPSMATGGCLWFPDLMVADPLHILPGMLSLLLFLNVVPGTKDGLRTFLGMDAGQGAVVGGSGRIMLQRTLAVFGLAVGPITLQLPAAIHLYWVSSTGITMLMKKAVDYVMPIPKPRSITPCKGRNTPFVLPKREKETRL